MGAAYLRGPNVRSQRRSGCTGKHGFNSAAEARIVIRYYDHQHMTSYRCEHCNHWHLTGKGKIFSTEDAR